VCMYVYIYIYIYIYIGFPRFSHAKCLCVHPSPCLVCPVPRVNPCPPLSVSRVFSACCSTAAASAPRRARSSARDSRFESFFSEGYPLQTQGVCVCVCVCVCVDICIYIYIFVYIYVYVYVYMYICVYIGLTRGQPPSKPVAPWPLPDIRSLQSFLAPVHHLCIASSICIAHTIAILLHD